MKIFTTTIGNDISSAKRFLEEGESVGIPTETVYGLAANALNDDAVLKIFSVKNRPYFDPLIVHVHHAKEIAKYVVHVPDLATALIMAFMPGPFTILLKKNRIISDLVTSGLEKVALRIPSHPLSLKLLDELSFPLAAPSANPFGYISPTTAQHVYDQLHGKIPYILDGGVASVGIESTIVDVEGDEVIIYRLGGISVEKIESVIKGKVRLELNSSSNPAAPGSLRSHYAPKKKLIIAESGNIPVGQAAWGIGQAGNEKIGVIGFDKYVDGISRANQILLSGKGDLEEAAKNLFSAMRKLDASDVEAIIAVKFPDQGLGRAINDRLTRASA